VSGAFPTSFRHAPAVKPIGIETGRLPGIAIHWIESLTLFFSRNMAFMILLSRTTFVFRSFHASVLIARRAPTVVTTSTTR
jgi:hypothetical protein